MNSFDNSIDNNIESNNIKKQGYDLFISIIKENMKKGKIRKCLEDLYTKADNYSVYPSNWEIYNLKLKCMNKIVSKKFMKYLGEKIKGLENWLNRIDKELIKWYNKIEIFLPINKDSDILVKKQYELILFYNLQNIYNYSLYFQSQEQIADSLAFLAQGERLFKNIGECFKNADIYNVGQKIYLFISSILISDNDFEAAKYYISNSLKFSFKEVKKRYENYIDRELTSFDKHTINKIYLNIIIGFYQLGVCEENSNIVVNAVDSYKQGKWMSKFLDKINYKEIFKFMNELDNRATIYFISIKTSESNQKKNRTNTLKQNISREVPFKYEKIYKEIITYKFNKLDSNDILEDKSENLKRMLDSYDLMNNLLSKKFNNLITSLDKIEVSLKDTNIVDKIQKKYNEINNEKIFKQKENEKKLKKTINSRNEQITKSVRNEYRNKAEVTKYDYDNLVFSRNFKNKIDYINKFAEKEIGFQKKLLSLKKVEKRFEHINYNRLDIKNESELLFNKLLKLKINRLDGDDVKDLISENQAKISNTIEKLESNVIKSLNSKVFDKYDEFKNSIKTKPRKLIRLTRKQPDNMQICLMNSQNKERLNMELIHLRSAEKNKRKELYTSFK